MRKHAKLIFKFSVFKFQFIARWLLQLCIVCVRSCESPAIIVHKTLNNRVNKISPQGTQA